jgi:uncharacterized protein involved in exopolysaccharide biosynthesis
MPVKSPGGQTPSARLAQLIMSVSSDPKRVEPVSRWGDLVRRVVIVVAIAIFAGILTYLVSSSVTPTYSSSAEVQVVVGGTSGLGTDSLEASNDLTAQLVQLVPTNKILSAPAAKLGLSTSALRSVISVGAVAQQNLLQISGEASSAARAQQIAVTVTQDFVSSETSDAQSLVASSSAVLSKRIDSLDAQLTRISAQLRTATGSQAALLQSEYGSTLTQSQVLSTQSADLTASGVPTITKVQSAGLGTQTAPRPTLYAIVGALVAAFIASQIFVVTDRRRRSRPV